MLCFILDQNLSHSGSHPWSRWAVRQSWPAFHETALWGVWRTSWCPISVTCLWDNRYQFLQGLLMRPGLTLLMACFQICPIFSKLLLTSKARTKLSPPGVVRSAGGRAWQTLLGLNIIFHSVPWLLTEGRVNVGESVRNRFSCSVQIMHLMELTQLCISPGPRIFLGVAWWDWKERDNFL